MSLLPTRVEDLQVQDFEAIAKEGQFIYVYLRNRYSEDGPYKPLTPYYVGKASRAKRIFERHNCAVPKDKRFVQVLKIGLNEEQANAWECHYISIWGRIDTQTGILRNLTDGGEGATGHVPSEDQIRRTNEAKARSKSEEYGYTIEEWNQFTETQKTSMRRQSEAAEKYGYTLQGWRSLTDEEITRIKAIHGKQMAEAAAKFGYSVEDWAAKPQSERRDYSSHLKTAEKNGYTLLEWMKLSDSKKQAIGKQTATAERLGILVKEWMSMTISQKLVYQRQLKLADKYDYDFAEWRSMTHSEKMKAASINRARTASEKFGVDVKTWLELTNLQREKIRDRYKRGVRVPELIQRL